MLGNDIHTAEPLVPGTSCLEVEIAIAKWKKYKSPSSDEIPEEIIQAVGEILLSAIHILINSVCNKEELSEQWKESIIVPVHKKGDKTD
jgi:predicted transcriptional regulator